MRSSARRSVGRRPGPASRPVPAGPHVRHPVPLRVEEVGLVRELQDGAARVQRGLHLLPDPLRHLLLREVRRVPRCAAQLVHRQPVPALVARAGVPPAAPPAPDDHRHVDQVLVVLVAEEALAQLGQPVLSALQGAHELLLPVAQQDVVVGPLSDEGLVVVEVLAGRPQAQVGVVALARPGQLPVRAREQRVGPRAASQVQHDGTIRPRASPGAAVRGLRDLLSLSRPTVLPVIPVAELSRPTLAAPLMLSELPDTPPVDDSAAPATVPVAVSAAQETAPEASTPVVKTSVQFTSLHSSWSQPTLPCAVSPSSVAEPVRASESASRSVTETDSPSKALALICMLYRSSVPADCCTSPGMEPPKAPNPDTCTYGRELFTRFCAE